MEKAMREGEGMHSRGPDQGLPFAAVRDHIYDIVAKWKNPPAVVKVVAKQSDLPEHIRNCILPGQTVKGAFDPQANTIHLVSANLESLAEGEAALIHEAIGHFGVEAILGGSARRYYTDVARLYGRQGLRDVAEEYGLDLNDPGDILTAAKEKVAYLAMSAKSRSGVLGRLIGETRDALRRIGFTLRLNETDIKTMIGRAEKLVKSGKHYVSLNGNPIHPLNGIIRFLYGGKNARGYGRARAKFCSLYDTKERFEINDGRAALKPLPTRRDGKVDAYLALGDVLHHPELYRHYPALRNLDVHIEIGPDLVATGKFTAFEDRSAEGLFDIQPEILVRAPDVESAMEIFIHEVQHCLQEEEGFAMGGNPDQFRMTTVERASWQADRRYWHAIRAVKTTAQDENLTLEEAAEILKREGDYEISATVVDNARIHTFASIQGQLALIDQALGKSNGFASYQAMAGEIEARDSMARIDLDAAGRRAVVPYSSENISPKEAIVQFGQSQDGRASRGVDKRRDRRRPARSSMSP